MKKVILWGIGEDGRRLLANQKYLFCDKYLIFMIIDNNRKLWNTEYGGRLIVPPFMLENLKYDYVLISSTKFRNEIQNQLENEYRVPKGKIIGLADLYNELAMKLISKYDESTDEDIQRVLLHYKKIGFNLYGEYSTQTHWNRVLFDKDDWPYIEFFGKKMFFPKNYKFWIRDGLKWVKDILYEQGENSPHLYVTNSFDIPENAVVVDAGTCEGNFSLRYIDKIRKLYIIEADPSWSEALKKTFAPYQDKVVFCNKYLSRFDSNMTVTLDALIKDKIDFLKMDIEGAEIDALLGGERVLRESNAMCAICSYHRMNDEENIKFILQNLGYDTEVSKGYMYFLYDPYIGDTLDFRRGVVYGYKKKF